MKKQILYSELARYYDLIYSKKDYKKETDKLKELISKYKKTSGNELLDVACGTGHHLKHMKDEFSCTGVDIKEEMLQLARKNVEETTFIQADMMTMDLGRKYDVITCLFSSIGYVRTLRNLRRTMRNFSRHLREGGIMIIEPWLTKSVYKVGSPHMETYDGVDVKIARLSVSMIRGYLSVITFHYLVAEKGLDVKHFVDRHELGLFEVEDTLEIMEESGLKSEFLQDGLIPGRGLYMGVKN